MVILLFIPLRSEEHTSELQSPCNLVCRLLLEKKKRNRRYHPLLLGCARVMPTDDDTAVALRSPKLRCQRRATPHPVTAPHLFCLFFFNDTATTEIYTLSLHDALPI